MLVEYEAKRPEKQARLDVIPKQHVLLPPRETQCWLQRPLVRPCKGTSYVVFQVGAGARKWLWCPSFSSNSHLIPSQKSPSCQHLVVSGRTGKLCVRFWEHWWCFTLGSVGRAPSVPPGWGWLSLACCCPAEPRPYRSETCFLLQTWCVLWIK